MSPIIEICVVILTVCLAALTIVAMITTRNFGRVLENTDRSLVQLEGLLGDAGRTLDEGRELLGSLRATLERVDSIAVDARHLSHRVAALSDTVLSEVEAPARRLVALSRGVKAAAGVLKDRWMRHTSNGFAARQGAAPTQPQSHNSTRRIVS